MDTQKWVRVGRVMGDTQCGVPGLEQGKQYKFRVKACNAEGESEALVAEEAILAKDPFGLCFYFYDLLWLMVFLLLFITHS